MIKRQWSDEEIELLKNSDNIEYLVLLNRTKQAIYNKAKRLGIIEKSARSIKHEWTKEEVELLKEHGHLKISKLKQYFPSLNKNQLQAKRNKLKIKCNKSSAARIYDFNQNYFASPSIENCYWAGFIAGDGCITLQGTSVYIQIKLQCTDIEILENFKKDINYNGPIKFVKSNKESQKDQVFIRLCGATKLALDLKNNFNIIPRKSLILMPPSLSSVYSLAYIKGYTDADGQINLYKDGNLFRIGWCGTIEIIDWIQSTIQQYFPTVNIRPQKKSANNTFELCVDNKKGIAIAKLLNAVPIRGLKRKWNKITY